MSDYFHGNVLDCAKNITNFLNLADVIKCLKVAISVNDIFNFESGKFIGVVECS